MTRIQNCFIEELRKLKESSKEAVENLKSFSKFKEYMHVKRGLQDELLSLIRNSQKVDKSQLIMVCGSVGDGKSHIISYLKEHYPNIIDDFNIHNDATESFSPKKTSIDTLREVLQSFSDENLKNNSNQKWILAINLGTLNNFIESKYKSEFSILREYVLNNQILETKVIKNSFVEDSHFQFINFSDYHMFTLTEEKPKSKYILNLINKVVESDSNNPFYRSYKSNCTNCNYKETCAVRFNYELLQKDSVQNTIINFLIEIIVKFKLIISTRDLLNFIYDIIVCDYDVTNLKQELDKKMSFERMKKYICSLIPMSLFEHHDLSDIFEHISRLDPTALRTEQLDQEIIRFNNTSNIKKVFKEYINLDNKTLEENLFINEQLLEKYCKTNEKLKSFKQILLKVLIRFYKFIPLNDSLKLEDNTYVKFMKDLYYWNKGDKKKLKLLYEDVEYAIYNWNGRNKDGYININLGKNQTDYKVSQEFNIKADTSNLKKKVEDNLDRFIPTINLQYKIERKNQENNSLISIDFSLYELLMKIKEGYRPNKRDKNNFISFTQFINKLIEVNGLSEEMYFEELQSEAKTRYKLVFDDEFEEYEFLEM
ncbi:hypothetical protein JCM16358_20550 [Halanaerocella petrolearia]